MKKFFLILFTGFIFLSLTCSTSKDITLDLTNPQNIAVAFDGYYQINDGPQEAMTGTTPEEYILTLSKGDEVEGIVYKSDSTNFTDTLHFRILVEGAEQEGLTADIVIPTILGGVQFTLVVQ
jgi:hypothetical protein